MECTFGLDGPVEVVFGNEPTVVMFTVLYKLNQLTKSRVWVLDGLSEVRSIVMEVLICWSFNNHKLTDLFVREVFINIGGVWVIVSVVKYSQLWTQEDHFFHLVPVLFQAVILMDHSIQQVHNVLQ